ncbi:MAG: hypothetical protein IPO81_27505 [Kouleothrix sp.]|nr:hypothetical protein [Kouleothrix sp.]
MAGTACSTSSAARPKSKPASAWPIASVAGFMLLVPGAGALMQPGTRSGCSARSCALKNFGKQMVIWIPLARAIQRHDKEVAALECFQPCAATLLTGDGIAERASQPLKNRGLE